MVPADVNNTTEHPLDENTIAALENAFQKDIVNDTGTKSSKTWLLFVVAIIVIIMGVFAFYALQNTTTNNEVVQPVNTNSGVVKPINSSQNVDGMYGKVLSVKDLNSEYEYELLSSDGKLLAYLTSEKHDLSLVEGLTVYVNGVSLKKANNVPVVLVSSVEFSK